VYPYVLRPQYRHFYYTGERQLGEEAGHGFADDEAEREEDRQAQAGGRRRVIMDV